MTTALDEFTHGTEPTQRSVRIVVVSPDRSVIDTVREVAQHHPEESIIEYVDDAARAINLVSFLHDVDIVVVHALDASAAPLLDRIRRSAPSVARLALADPTDASMLLDLATVAHRFLPLPLDGAQFTEMIERSRRSARTELSDPVLTLVGQADRLPSPPKIFERLSGILMAEDWDLDDLVDEISVDAGLASEILKLVNSSFYGTSNRIMSVGRAISLIGARLTCSIVLGNKVFQSSGGFDTWIDLERLGERSKTVAAGAHALAVRAREPKATCASAHLAGLVSEIGLLVLARIPDISPSIAAPVNNSTYLSAERVLFGGDRFEVGAHLLTLWGFDDEITDAVRRLSSGRPSPLGHVGWYVATARRLVLDEGIHPDDLAVPPGTDPEIDQIIARAGAATATVSDALSG